MLKVVAHRPLALAGAEARQRFGVIKGRSVQGAFDRLVADGLLVSDTQTRNRWRAVDPFLGR